MEKIIRYIIAIPFVFVILVIAVALVPLVIAACLFVLLLVTLGCIGAWALSGDWHNPLIVTYEFLFI